MMTTTQSTQRQRRIVVGVDGSEPSKQALRWAGQIAGALDAEITAIAAWHIPIGYGISGSAFPWDPAEDTTKALTEAVDEVFGPHRPIGIELLVGQGNSAEVLLDRSRDALMLIVGSRGHGGFAGLLLGSVSSSVAEHATCPVLVVHGDRGVAKDG